MLAGEIRIRVGARGGLVTGSGPAARRRAPWIDRKDSSCPGPQLLAQAWGSPGDLVTTTASGG